MDGRRFAPLAPALAVAVLSWPGQAAAPRPAPGDAPPGGHAVAAAVPAPAPAPEKRFNAAELNCLALNVYWESRGEPAEGQAAVAHVTLNRASSDAFPKSVCAVVHQSGQFGWTADGRDHTPSEGAAWERAQAVARQAAAGGGDPTGGALYFHHLSERPQWARGRYANKLVIGEHVFFNVIQPGDPQLAEAVP